MLRSILPLAALACGITTAQAANAGELVQLPVRDQQTQSVYLEQPSAPPRWVVILYAGDDGAVGLNNSGPTALRGNFLLRTASYWTAAGDAAAIFDAPSDQSSGMDDAFRLGEAHAKDIHAVIAALRQRFPSAKIALIGTSRGTISVGNALKRAPHDADAYVLTSPVTIAFRGQAGLSGMRWDVGTTPVLVVSNENDACRVSPFNAAHALADDSRLQFLA
ncbi:MAG TPA: hypothetical protein VEI25_08510, partial [Paraburkholderia sp.]|nr:hypothetical protein [Paraburkholderia sp.]